MSNRLLLSPRHRRILEALLREHLPDVEVWAYGSRVNGRGHEGSDLDLVLRSPGLREIPLDQLIDFKDAVRESNIPFLVEARDWARLPERFQREIEGGHVVLYQSDERRGSRGWSRLRLEDCMELGDEFYRTTDDWAFVNYLDTGSVKEGRVSAVKHLVFGEDKVPSRARRKVRYGDIVYSTVRPNQRHFGLLKEIPPNFLVSTGFCVIRGHPSLVDTRFLYWFLAQDRVIDHLQTIAEHSASTYPSIRPSDIESLEIGFPCMAEQRAITHILGTLDDKIELNRRMNETLEAMTRALFKSWFVDFDPVRAKMKGRDTGLPKHIADLFPDRLVESELGKIPEGWRVGNVSDICKKIENGGTPKRSVRDYWNGNIQWFKTSELVDEPLLNSSEQITQKGLDHSSCKRWPKGTVLIALYAAPTVGRLGILEISATANQACCGLDAEPNFGNQFLYYVLLFRRSYFHRIAVGAAQQNISQKIVRDCRIIIPCTVISRTFHSWAEAIYSQRVTKLSESRTLSDLRNTLLPKLILGEIRLPKAGTGMEAQT